LWVCASHGAELFEVGREGHWRARTQGGEQPEGSDALRGVFARFAERSVGAGLVLVVGEFGQTAGDAGSAALLRHVPEASRVVAVSVGVELSGVHAGVLHLGGAAATRTRLLDEQLRRRRRRRVPSADQDPAWTIRETGTDPLRHRVTETLFTLGTAGTATRGSVEEAMSGSMPLVVANGIYDGTASDQHLLPAPGWTGLEIESVPPEDVRVLDLRTGVLVREESSGAHPVRSLRLVSASLRGAVAVRAEAAVGRLRAGPALQPPRERSMTGGRLDQRRWARVRAVGGAGIAAVARQRTGRDGGVRTVERLGAYVADSRRQPPLGAALEILDAAETLGFDRLLAEHRAVWAARWDADVFVLPAVVSTDPAMAKAMIRYRLRWLPAAQTAAQAAGRRGARFAWNRLQTARTSLPPSRGWADSRCRSAPDSWKST
jgi:Glycosyl hydrolase family 65 central catalytic domain/Glycosyl hydrolase family 65, N-terminal domain